MKSKILFMSMLAMAVMFSSCGGDDDDDDDVVEPVFQARFSYDGGVRRPAPAKVVFENNSELATSYLWKFGDGDSSTAENPTHYYQEAGTYQVVLTAYNDAGEERTRESEIVIYEQPTHLKIETIGMEPVAIEEAELEKDDAVFLILYDASGDKIDYTGKGASNMSGVFVQEISKGLIANFGSTEIAEDVKVKLGSSLKIEFIDVNQQSLATYTLEPNDVIPTDSLETYPAMYSIEKGGEVHVDGNCEWYVNSTPFDN
jgi:PKD repeat protein